LVSPATSKRLPITIEKPRTYLLNERWLLGYDDKHMNIFSFDCQTGEANNLTKDLPIPVGDAGEDRPEAVFDRGFMLSNLWLKNDEAVLGYDRFDIWLLDPQNKKKPVNITNGWGRKQRIQFRIADYDGFSKKIFEGNETLILSAFDSTTKQGGFYKIRLGQKQDPVLLSSGPYNYGQGQPLVKAANANVYLLSRSTASDAPNYFWTKDFITFHPVSHLYPEKQYNWLTSELISFSTLDGRKEQAIMYKPENFDPAKNYPVIINYYELRSQEVNTYFKPHFTNGQLDISWFVSHGYLVCVPDIHYMIGEPGQSCYNSVMGLVNRLGAISYVDIKHIGIQGHSWGGFQTNYLITHTNKFAAAISSSGNSDFVSGYGSLDGINGRGPSHQFFYEYTQCRIGTSLWERPDLYIKNSPVFYLDRVTTPVLTIANKKDGRVNFEQELELFTGLRRLGKRAWMLQYDEGGHGVSGKSYVDYIIRSTQFFDHYLKDSLPPVWMTHGLPANKKGTTLGYELDHEIKTPPVNGLLNEEQQARFKAMKNRKPITITFQ
jgi:dipeptidyl aminopeptidase/acylaminoacyl peptidase